MKNLIVASEEIPFNSNVKERIAKFLSPAEMKEAEANSKRMTVKRIRYLSSGHEVVGFIVEPRGTEKRPCIIYNRGGNREFGALKLGHLFLGLSRIASWGYVVVASQYSGNDGGEGKDEEGGKDVDDVLVLRDVLRAVPTADLTRIGMVGGSRGGMMTYQCVARVKWIKAAVSTAGAANFVRQAKLRPAMKKVFKECFSGSTAEMRKRSAVFWADKFNKKTPLLLLHGTADWRVSPLDSLDLSRELLAYKIPHRLVMFEGGDHFLSEFIEEKNRLIRDWLDRFVARGEALPKLKPHGK